MSRSGYSEDYDGDNWATICWRGAVASAIRGRRGQAFLREMLEALDALPEKRLIAHEFAREGEVCAIASVARQRGVDLSDIDPEDDSARYPVARRMGIPQSLVAEIIFENDEHRAWDHAAGRSRDETPEERFARVHAWVASLIKGDK